MVVGADNRPAAKLDEKSSQTASDEQAEIAALRAEVVALTREASVLRWQIGKLLELQPAISAGVAGATSLLRRKFPRSIEKIAQLKRAVTNRASSQPHAKLEANVPRQTIKIGALQLATPVLVAAEGALASRLVEMVPAALLVRLTPGAGLAANVPVPPLTVVPMRQASPDSLAVFLADNPAALRSVGTIVVDQGDDVSLALLRGRMVKDQALVLIRGKETSEILIGLGASDVEEGGYALHSKFGDAWLDPLDEDNDPRVSIAYWPKISVVMVSFNQASFLEEGLCSILDQKYPNLEFIVIDGNSSDGSIEILERYRSRLSTLVIESDKGQADGLNKGLARATGDIMTWVNSDDLLEPGALFRVAQAFMAHKVDMVAGGCRQIGLTRSHVIHNHHTRLPYALPMPLPLGLLLEMYRFWLNGCFFYQPEVFFSRDIWMRSGAKLRTDLNYVLDYDLWVRMAAVGATIVHIPDFLACSRTHDQQKTTVGMPYLPEVERLLREYASRLALPPDSAGR